MSNLALQVQSFTSTEHSNKPKCGSSPALNIAGNSHRFFSGVGGV